MDGTMIQHCGLSGTFVSEQLKSKNVATVSGLAGGNNLGVVGESLLEVLKVSVAFMD